jgi:ferredoxin
MLYVKVDPQKCCGFGICRHSGPDVFESDERGFSFAAFEAVPPELEGQARDGAEVCPANAIYCGETPPAP